MISLYAHPVLMCGGVKLKRLAVNTVTSHMKETGGNSQGKARVWQRRTEVCVGVRVQQCAFESV